MIITIIGRFLNVVIFTAVLNLALTTLAALVLHVQSAFTQSHTLVHLNTYSTWSRSVLLSHSKCRFFTFRLKHSISLGHWFSFRIRTQILLGFTKTVISELNNVSNDECTKELVVSLLFFFGFVFKKIFDCLRKWL